MTDFILLDVCPICFGGPVVQGDKWLVGAFSITKPFVCAQCGSVLRSLKGGRYRYTAVSSEHAEWAHLQESNDAYWFGSLEELEAWASKVIEQHRRKERLAAEEQTRQRLQPKTLNEFLGQPSIKERLAVSIQASRARGVALGHVLLCGPEASGKRTLAHVIANEMGAHSIWIRSAREVEKPWEVAEWLALQERDVIFVDDIDRARPDVVDFLSGVMREFVLATLPLARFTLVGATDEPKRVSALLLQRFEHVYEFERYQDKALGELVNRRAQVLGIDIDDEASWELGRGGKGTIREAERLLDRARDYAQVKGGGTVTLDIARWAVHGTVPASGKGEPEPDTLTWQDFEDFVAKLFRTLGYQNVRVTPRGADGGKDVVMDWADPLRGTRGLYVECKHWQAGSVGRREVQILHSAVMANPEVDEGVIVTTGSFTDGAIDYAKRVGVIQLIDRKELRELMAKAEILESST